MEDLTRSLKSRHLSSGIAFLIEKADSEQLIVILLNNLACRFYQTSERGRFQDN